SRASSRTPGHALPWRTAYRPPRAPVRPCAGRSSSPGPGSAVFSTATVRDGARPGPGGWDGGMSDGPNDSTGLPLRAHRFIREIGPGDGPVPGRLVAGDDEAFVAVDAALLADWGGWEHAGAAHIAGPQDLVRR